MPVYIATKNWLTTKLLYGRKMNGTQMQFYAVNAKQKYPLMNILRATTNAQIAGAPLIQNAATTTICILMY